MDGMGAMAMTFSWSTEVTVLFDGWTTGSLGQYAVAVVVVVIAGVVRHAISNTRLTLAENSQRTASLRALDALMRRSRQGDDSPGAAADGEVAALLAPPPSAPRTSRRLWMALLYATTAGLGLLQMLVAMTYNTGLFLAVVAGEGLGYFLFVDDDEKQCDELHC